MEAAETMLCACCGCAKYKRLSASMSSVKQAAHFAPFGHGTGMRIKPISRVAANRVGIAHLGSSGCLAAVKAPSGAGHECRRIAREERNDRGDVGRRAEPCERNR